MDRVITEVVHDCKIRYELGKVYKNFKPFKITGNLRDLCTICLQCSV